MLAHVQPKGQITAAEVRKSAIAFISGSDKPALADASCRCTSFTRERDESSCTVSEHGIEVEKPENELDVVYVAVPVFTLPPPLSPRVYVADEHIPQFLSKLDVFCELGNSVEYAVNEELECVVRPLHIEFICMRSGISLLPPPNSSPLTKPWTNNASMSSWFVVSSNHAKCLVWSLSKLVVSYSAFE